MFICQYIAVTDIYKVLKTTALAETVVLFES
jgi:hypothetical protein